MKSIILTTLICTSLGSSNFLLDLNSKNVYKTDYNKGKSSDDTTTEKRKISSFEGVEISSAINVTVSDGNFNGEISLDAPAEIMNKIITEVKDGILKVYIEEGKKNSTLKNQTVKINFPHNKLNSYKISGATKVDVASTHKVDKLIIGLSGASKLKLDVVSNTIKISNSGASSLEISGSVQDLRVSVSGASKLDALKLKANDAEVDCSGASSSKIWAVKDLVANSTGASSIRYIDESGLNSKIKSSGASSVKKYAE